MQVNNRYRPTYHASVSSAWSNDPNGVIWYRGRAHLFFQHYPHKAQWGPMHWGHISSEDFVKWEEHPIALVPDQEYEEICGCCSGSSVEIDGRMWLMYTAAQPELQRQCLASSEDGIHFTKHKGNPILTSYMLHEEVSPRDFRDPKIIKKDGSYYCLAGTRIIDPDLYRVRQERLRKEAEHASLYSSSGSPAESDPEDKDRDVNPSRGFHDPSSIPVLGGDERGALGNGNMILLRSRDLFNWDYCGKLFEKQDEFDEAFFKLQGVYECPEYFVSNDTEILLASPQNLPQMGHRFQNIHSVIYMTGHLDFETGHFDIHSIEDLDSGFDIYASQVIVVPDGRKIMIAWKEMWDRSYPTQEDNWVGSYTLPRELSYKNDHLYQTPVREITRYRQNRVCKGPVSIKDSSVAFEGIEGRCIELIAKIDPGDSERTGIRVFKGRDHETVISYDPVSGTVIFDRTRSGIAIKTEGDRLRYCDIDKEPFLRLHIFLDVSSVEVFINDGRYTMTSNVYPDPEDIGIEFFSQGGTAVLYGLEKYDLIV